SIGFDGLNDPDIVAR
nr:RecName: Full=Endochitinase 1 [Capsicum annuum var. annuum]